MDFSFHLSHKCCIFISILYLIIHCLHISTSLAVFDQIYSTYLLNLTASSSHMQFLMSVCLSGLWVTCSCLFPCLFNYKLHIFILPYSLCLLTPFPSLRTCFCYWLVVYLFSYMVRFFSEVYFTHIVELLDSLIRDLSLGMTVVSGEFSVTISLLDLFLKLSASFGIASHM